jgi:hypothetical protein
MKSALVEAEEKRILESASGLHALSLRVPCVLGNKRTLVLLPFPGLLTPHLALLWLAGDIVCTTDTPRLMPI